MKGLEQAITAAGSTYALAEKLGCRQSRISMWVTRGQVPAHHCIAVEQAVAGAVTRYELRPDVFGAAPVDEQKAA